MKFQYGSYQHATDEVDISSFTKTIQYDDRGFPQTIKNTMKLTGVLVPSGASQSATSSAIASLENAYSINGRDAALLHDDGTITAHSMRSSNFLGGVRVTELSYPSGAGLAYSVGRAFSITLEGLAEYTGGGESNPIVSFKETVTRTGSGRPRIVAVEVANGPPQIQTVAQQTIIRFSQRGSQTANRARQQPPGPLLEHIVKESVSNDNPEQQEGEPTLYKTTWSYDFISLSADAPFPHER